ncbi:ESPR domain-containing protein, partial [Variovorax saccharolyticus]|uniref:ESPR domain-containing protein n=1 Tax=Variovorax saccharolyticus TaxID=3053516 RepID=UPI0025757AC4
MNKSGYRVVFNSARGIRMVVQETARSAGKAPGTTPALLSVAAAAAVLALAPAQAQIAGDPNAPGHQRPT